MPLSDSRACGMCSVRVPIRQMKYDSTGTKLICPICVDKERNPIKEGTTHSLRAASVRQSSASLGDSSSVSYYCIACNFQFSRKGGVEVSRCPYCDREGSLRKSSSSAQELLDE